MLLDGFVSLLESILMFLAYVGYVVFAGVFAYRAARQQQLEAEVPTVTAAADGAKEESSASEGVALEPVVELQDMSVDDKLVQDVDDFDSAGDDNLSVAAFSAVAGRWWYIPQVEAVMKKWGKKSAKQRIFWLVFAFLRLPLTLTCIDVRWHKWLDCYLPALTFLFSPLVVVVACGFQSTWLGGVFPVLALGLIIGFVVAVASVVLLRRIGRPGKAVALALSVWTFVLSILWIYLLAHELVAILQALGKLLSISDVILGATVLAWGSSVGDTVSNILVAKQGFPQTAIAAAFGGEESLWLRWGATFV